MLCQAISKHCSTTSLVMASGFPKYNLATSLAPPIFFLQLSVAGAGWAALQRAYRTGGLPLERESQTAAHRASGQGNIPGRADTQQPRFPDGRLRLDEGSEQAAAGETGHAVAGGTAAAGRPGGHRGIRRGRNLCLTENYFRVYRMRGETGGAYCLCHPSPMPVSRCV